MTQQNSSSPESRPTVLKLLSGPQLGAEVPLRDGEYLIGSGDDADVVLLDDSVAASHAQLIIRDGQIAIASQDQAITIGNRQLNPGEQKKVLAGSLIGLGTTYIGIGPEETDWLKLTLPEVIGQRADSESDGPDGDEAVEDMDAESNGELEPALQLEPSPDTATSGLVIYPDQPQSHWGRWLAVCGGLAMIILLLVVFGRELSNWWDADAMVADTGPSPQEKAQAIVADLGLKDIKFSTRNDGTVVLQGYCDTSATKQRLNNALRAAGINAENQIWPEDWLQSALKETLHRLGGGQRLTHEYLGEGVVQLQGYLPDTLTHEELITIVQSDVPAIRRIEGKVLTLGDWVAELRSRVEDAGLDEQVFVEARGERVLATGLVGPEALTVWQPIAKQFAAETANLPPLESLVKIGENLAEVDNPVMSGAQFMGANSTEFPLADLNITVLGVVLGQHKPPYAWLGDGTKVSEGDIIKADYVVETIEFDRIIVSNHAKKHVYYVEEIHGGKK